MCGIAGYAHATLAPRNDQAELQSMCDAITHRGPDDEGLYAAPGIGLGMRRLSIIDVAGGRQPIANEDSTVHVVFNGEIYNHRSLRRSLLDHGHRFSSNCDTETLVHLYEERGPALVDALRGMFAFAIWDARTRQLLLARDRLGIKPLYYWEREDGCIYFCSELRSLLALRTFPRTIDRDAIAWYLALGYVPDPLSIFARVKKLPPGHTLLWTPGGRSEIRQYWTPNREEARGLGAPTASAEGRRLRPASVPPHPG